MTIGLCPSLSFIHHALSAKNSKQIIHIFYKSLKCKKRFRMFLIATDLCVKTWYRHLTFVGMFSVHMITLTCVLKWRLFGFKRDFLKRILTIEILWFQCLRLSIFLLFFSNKSIVVAADESLISWGPSPTYGELVRHF